MIIWLASYPKSGNTFLRSLLSSYFFSIDGNFKFKYLKEILQFPSNNIFEEIGVDIRDKFEVSKNYIKAQEKINQKKTIKFFKTHSSFCKMYNQFNFSNLQNSLGVIYIVRDPRNIVTSFSNHNSKSIEETVDLLINDKTIQNEKNEVEIYTGSWSFNYNSWKIFKTSDRYLLIKYEDLVKDTKKIFLEVLNFIERLGYTNFKISEDRISNIIETTKFERLQNLEKKIGFEEAQKNDKTGKKVQFFYLGPNNKWEDKLDLKIKNKLETLLKKEMIELGYL